MRPLPLRPAAWTALLLSTLLPSILLPAHAADAADDAAAATAEGGSLSTRVLDAITVSATLTEHALDEVAGSVTVIERERMDQTLTLDLDDLLRYEPGVSVRSGYGRFGIGDIAIRGLGGNRVRIETDGIAVPDAFAIGSYSDANRNFVDMDTLKRVEIIRGPASSLYGSDALGGVVSFVTKDPSDYTAAGEPAHLGSKLAYDGASATRFLGATAARAGDRWSGLLTLGHTRGHASDNQGDNMSLGALRTAPNPQTHEGRSLLGKLVYAPDASQRLKLTVDASDDETDTAVLHLLGLQPRTGANTLSLFGDDQQRRRRLSIAHEHDALPWALADRLNWQLYRQHSDTTQQTFEEQLTARRVALRREREFRFDQRVTGFKAALHKGFDGAHASHLLTWGIDLARTEIAQQRDGRAIDHATGVATNVVPPDVFPVRDFPLSTISNLALFAQDEIWLFDGRLTLLPGLRADRYALRPALDPVFATDNPGLVPADITETSLSPKLGAVWQLIGDWSMFGNYARGFRSPPYNNVNAGFANLQHGYATIPNPDLQPETSHGHELGLRYAGPVLHASVAGFLNRYRDFIESGVVVSRPPESPLLLYQSRNVGRAEIRGLEATAQLDLGALGGPWQGWSLHAAAAWQRGEDQVADRPLSTIDPPRGTLGLRHAAELWGVELVGRFAARKRRLPDPTQFATPGYAVFDLLAHVELGSRARLDFGVFNLGDRHYWDAANVGAIAASSPLLDRYTRPGRTVSASVAVDW